MQTRKYPRTMQEAFGPYTSRDLQERDSGYSPAWYYAMATIAFATLILIAVTR